MLIKMWFQYIKIKHAITVEPQLSRLIGIWVNSPDNWKYEY